MRRMLSLAVLATAFLVAVPAASGWSWPIDGPVLRPFSLSADAYAAGQHRGLDIGAAVGTPVAAPVSGTVSFAGSLPGGGRALTIETADGHSVTLLQLGYVAVARGSAVVEGVVVGVVGESEDAVTLVPHVHLGVRAVSDPAGYLDPLAFLPARPPVLAPEPSPPVESPVPAAPIAPEPPSPPVTEAPTVAVEAAPSPTPTPAAEPVPPAAVRVPPTSSRGTATVVPRELAPAPVVEPSSPEVEQVRSRPRPADPAPAARSVPETRAAHVGQVRVPTVTPPRRAVEPLRPRSAPRDGFRPPALERAATAPPAPERATTAPSARPAGPSVLLVLAASVAACVAALAAGLHTRRRVGGDAEPARIMGGDVVDASEDPGRGRLAVCERSAAHWARSRLRSPVGHLRPVPPSAGQRRFDGQRHRRARHARDGRR